MTNETNIITQVTNEVQTLAESIDPTRDLTHQDRWYICYDAGAKAVRIKKRPTTEDEGFILFPVDACRRFRSMCREIASDLLQVSRNVALRKSQGETA